MTTDDSRRAELGFGVIAGLGREILEPLAESVGGLGYRAFWINDSARPEADGLVGLAIVHDIAPQLELGVGVLPLDRRSPEEIAEEIERLDLPLGMLRLGVGSGASDHPLATVREGVARLHELLPAAHLYVAALGPKMCHLAGEVADGVLFNWATPARLARTNAWVDEGALAAGPDARTVERWSYIRATTGPDARHRLGAEAGRYARSPAYGRAFTAQRVRRDEVGIAGDDLAAQLLPYRQLLDGAVVRALPEEWDLGRAIEIARLAAGAGAPPSTPEA